MAASLLGMLTREQGLQQDLMLMVVWTGVQPIT